MGSAPKELISVRKGEELPEDRLIPYLRHRIPDLPEAPIEIEQFAAGHSNLTYLIRCGDFEGVLRRPPLGPVAAKAHDMRREFQVLQAVHPLFKLAPRPILFCDDESVIGCTFQMMERRRGIVIDGDWPEEYPRSQTAAEAVSLAPIETMAQLHSIDYRETGLAELVHPEGYLERQVHGWLARYDKAKTDEIAAANEVAERLTRDLPISPPATIVHNDLKLNNMLLAPHAVGQVTAVVDWEMATVGDPLTDLATTLSYWPESGDPELLRHWLGHLGKVPGMLTRRDLIEAYANRTGRDVGHLSWYLMFAYFKVGVICQQIYFRWVHGQTKDGRFQALGTLAKGLIEHAVDGAGKC
jgi:aminoglycoside phosphotransferase (APT) family kinase protein